MGKKYAECKGLKMVTADMFAPAASDFPGPARSFKRPRCRV
jgi:hypothetical protein